ncbi:biotin--[acetyl-CoA-carboxylase] ligase [Sulfitobacter sp. JB4-11]|uniref:biotin--[acetyl-CoA-carboxylase] ligase n=1 Tax=Sulfitobacter rhodophyticola TaxID=3238304 RepID=UPI0035128FD5
MTGWPEGYGRHVFDSVGSTLVEAQRMAPTLAGPAWLLAHEQTAARGRRGRPWATPRGNFAGTLVLPTDDPPQTAALRSFVASLALFEAFVAVTGTPQAFALKWPNDVLLRGEKVAGILLETAGRHLIIGIGVNLIAAPGVEEVEAGAVRPVSLKSALGLTISPEAFLDALAAAYAPLEARFRQSGFAPIRRDWLHHAARLGEVITARTMRDSWRGRFEDVDENGNLVLSTADGRLAIAAADVYFDET